MPDNLFSRWMTRGVDALVLLSGWWLILLSLATCFEMVSRKMFQYSLQGIDEIGGYTLAVTSAIGFSYTLITRGHTRIDFLVSKLPPKGRALMNTLAMASLAALATFATYRASSVLAETIEFQSTATTPLQTPMWIPQSLWFTGYALFAIIAVYLAAHAMYLLLSGRDAELNKLYGPQTLEEEIESEAGDVLRDARASSQGTSTQGPSTQGPSTQGPSTQETSLQEPPTQEPAAREKRQGVKA